MNWRAVLRDVAIGLAIVFAGILLLQEAGRRQPDFSAADIRVVEAPIAEFTTVQVPETAAAPQRNSGTLRARSALRLAGYPPNLLAYIPGSGWDLAGDLAVGTVVRLEVTEDPAAAADQARAYPEATMLLPIAGLQIGDRVYFRAIESVQRAEQAAGGYQWAGVAALGLAVLWLGWTVWSHRHAWGVIMDVARDG